MHSLCVSSTSHVDVSLPSPSISKNQFILKRCISLCFLLVICVILFYTEMSDNLKYGITLVLAQSLVTFPK